MHEFGVAEGLLKAVLHAAETHGATRVVTVRLRIGHLAGIVPESLTFAFEALAQDTLAHGATLHIQSIPVTCHCPHCRLDFPCSPGFYQCPTCNQSSSDLRTGRELDIIDMEIT
ncbi:MAG TPA: hydrogenase maturation nickel metallochaperone HypA [Kiritimatiellia bacterium]|nr:hydrogenase maturation nickel metallochaperone HypA [Kiritimatiellia bacterium]